MVGHDPLIPEQHDDPVGVGPHQDAAPGRPRGRRRCSGCALWPTRQVLPGVARIGFSTKPAKRPAEWHQRGALYSSNTSQTVLAHETRGGGCALRIGETLIGQPGVELVEGLHLRAGSEQEVAHGARPGSRPGPSPSPGSPAYRRPGRSGSGCTSAGSGGCSGAPCPRRSRPPPSSCCRRSRACRRPSQPVQMARVSLVRREIASRSCYATSAMIPTVRPFASRRSTAANACAHGSGVHNSTLQSSGGSAATCPSVPGT